MAEKAPYNQGDALLLTVDTLPDLLTKISDMGYSLIGPTVRDRTITLGEIDGIEDLPAGQSDDQEAATYRLKQREDKALFGYNVGQCSVKRFLYPPRCVIWSATRKKNRIEIHQEENNTPRLAFIGIRPCELNAVLIQDRVFTQGEFFDDDYKKRRDNVLLVAVNCTEAGKTCFCASMNTGPRAETGFDLALTEIMEADDHYFYLEVGTEKGAAAIAEMKLDRADDKHGDVVASKINDAVENMGRSLDTTDVRELFIRNVDNVYWDSVGRRCLNCANCTLVCPTCFCSTVEDSTDLSGTTAQRLRRWDSCFTMDFSYIHGGSVRPSAKARYRQWITHKLANWHDQFGTSGCVGCGRCITWCPVGIDITEETRALRQRDLRPTAISEKTEV